MPVGRAAAAARGATLNLTEGGGTCSRDLSVVAASVVLVVLAAPLLLQELLELLELLWR